MLDRAIVPLVLAVMAAANAFAFSPRFAGQLTFVWVLAVPSLVFAAIAIYRMDRDGTLLELFRVRAGDVSIGVGTTLGIGLAIFGVRSQVMPAGSPADAWLLRLYLHLGKTPDDRSTYALVAVAFLVVALLEEITWRGLVQQVLEERFGVKKGWLLTASLYALAYVPTLWMLRMPPAGLNPLLPAAALLCGTIWGFLAGRLQRLPPVLLSHALFTFAFGLQYRL
jgi:uncharacterized protein